MKTKINKITLIFLASATLLFGCSKSFLETQPVGLSVSNYYKTDQDATTAITDVYAWYRTMYSSVWTSMWLTKTTMSDEILTGGANSGDQPDYQAINHFTFTASNSFVTGLYRDEYQIINRCNLIVDNFSALASPSTYQLEVIGEAKTLRAMAYFDLVTLWGDPPLVLHQLAPADYNQPNSTPSELWAQIEKDLTDAIKVLPVKSAQAAAGSDAARVSKGYAQALLGKAYVFEKKWSDAETILKDVINSGEYSLYTMQELGWPGDSLAYTQLFRKSTEFGKESVFEISYNNGRGQDWGNSYGDIWNDPSRTNPSNIIVELCGPRGDEGFNGTPYGITNAGWGFGYPTPSIYKAFKDAHDTVRMAGNILTWSQLRAKGGNLCAINNGKETNLPWGCPGYVRLKYTTWQDETTGPVGELNYGTNFRIMRYSEVLLLASEAAFNNGDMPSALDYYNQVHTRVLMPAKASITLDDIKLERRLELAFEGDRYQDLVRWGDAAATLANQGATIPSGIITAGTLMPAGADAVQHYDISTVQFGTYSNPGAGFVAPKNNLFPFPETELQANTLLKQNPGY